jgi:ABC-type oligopeptide transport system substrate-binding subunit
VWLALAGLVVATAVLAAGGVSASTQKGGTLRLSSTFDIDSVDPALAGGPQSIMIDFATCARLYNVPDRGGRAGTVVIPEVARSFPKVSSDGKTQTIELRRNYRFDTGRPVTAANFVAAIDRSADPRLQSAYTQYMHEIVGVDAVLDGKAKTVSGVRAVGPYALRIRTTRPLPDLASRLSMPAFCPVAVGTPPTELHEQLGSGPYYIASWVPNRQVVLERNRYYRGPRPANVDRVVWSVGLSSAACRQEVEQDQVDYCEFLSTQDYQDLAGKYGINARNGRFHFAPTLATAYFAFNHDRKAFKGPGQIPLIRAINWAIDRPALVRASGFLGGKRTDQILPPAMTRPASIYPLASASAANVAKARALLAKARYKPDKLVLYTATTPSFFAVWAQIFRFDLKRLGIDVDIKYFPNPGTLFTKAGTRGEPFDVVSARWSADYPDPSTFFVPLLDGTTLSASGNSNVAYFDRPKYNRAIERIDRMSGAARRKAWADLDVEMMRDDPPWAPFLNGTRADFVSKSFGCYVLQPVLGRIDIAAACKK